MGQRAASESSLDSSLCACGSVTCVRGCCCGCACDWRSRAGYLLSIQCFFANERIFTLLAIFEASAVVVVVVAVAVARALANKYLILCHRKIIPRRRVIILPPPQIPRVGECLRNQPHPPPPSCAIRIVLIP